MTSKSPVHDLDERSRSASAVPENMATRNSTLVRWVKFNLVGAFGIGVQFGALFLLKGLLHWQYLVATAIAVEIAVLHNFVWHEQFTWADRAAMCSDGKHLSSDRADFRSIGLDRLHSSLHRLWRFHLANGAISILGNLLLMRVMVGIGNINYLVANAIAIAVCSIINFLLSDQWVFEK